MSNRIKICIRNFQAIEHVEFECDGFTTIHGQSEIGKSSILRAINHCITNRLGNDYIRHGERDCYVSINFIDKSFRIEWFKNPEKSYYVINGDYDNPFENLNGAIPQPVIDFGLGVFKTEATGVKYHPQLCSDQFNTVFFLFEPAPVKAEILSEVSNITNVVGARKLASKDLKTAKTLLKDKQTRFKTMDDKLDLLNKGAIDSDYEEILEASNSLIKTLKNLELSEELSSNLEIYQKIFPSLNVDLLSMDCNTSLTDNYIKMCESYSSLRLSKSIMETLDGLDSLQKIDTPLYTDTTTYEKLLFELGSLTSLSEHLNIGSIEWGLEPEHVAHIYQLEQLFCDLNSSNFLMESLSSISSSDSVDLPVLVDKYIELAKNFGVLNRLSSLIVSVSADIPFEDDYTPDLFISVSKYYGQYVDILEQISTLNSELIGLNQELEEARVSLSEFKKCPFCDSSLEHSHE